MELIITNVKKCLNIDSEVGVIKTTMVCNLSMANKDLHITVDRGYSVCIIVHCIVLVSSIDKP